MTNFIRLSVLLCTLAIIGCSRPQPVIVRATFEWSGAGPADIDEQVALPVITATAPRPSIVDAQALSYAGRTDIFFELERNDVLPELEHFLANISPQLPHGCRLKEIHPLPAHQKVPEPTTGEADQLNVRLNKVAPLERLGISSADVAAEIGKLLESRRVSAENPDDLGQLKIKIDGHEFRLHEIAEISITKEPRCIARNLSGRRIR